MAAPNILCDTAGMTNAQWLAARMHGPSGKIPYTVGGSDVAAVFGVSPWTTPLELWMIKKGRMKPPAKSNANQLEMGHLLEPIAAHWYAKKTGNRVYEDTNLYQHADHPYALANFDRRFERASDGEPGILECKSCTYHKASEWDNGAIPLYLEHIFPYLGIRFIAVNNHYDSDQFIGTTGGIDVAFRNFMYEMYSVDISKKVKTSQHMLMRSGRYVSHCPYGYTKIKGQKHHMVPDPETAPTVRDIFLWAIEGKKSTEIARILNEKHIPTPMQHKKLSRQGISNDAMWSHQAVIRIIRDYKYTGAMVSFKCGNETIRAKVQKRYAPEDYVINEGMHEPIVTHDEYYAANDTLRKVKKYDVVRTDRRDRVYYCGHCGRRLRKTFGLDEYYSCATPLYIRDAPCAGIHWSRTNIEDVVFTTYKRQLQIVSEEYCRTVNEKQPDKLAPLRAQQKSLRIQLGGIGSKVASLYEQFRSDEISRNAFLEKKGALSEDRDRLQTELSRIEDEIEGLLQKQEESNTAMNAIKNIAAAADEPDDKLRERMYDDIDRVIVFDNENLKIEWKFDVAFQLS